MNGKILRGGFPFPTSYSDSDSISSCSDQENELTQVFATTGTDFSTKLMLTPFGFRPRLDLVTDIISRLLEDYSSCSSEFSQPTSGMNPLSPANICGNYGYSICMDDMSDFLCEDFFQNYANRSGYTLTVNFLSEINRIRGMFVEYVNATLSRNEFSRFLFKINAYSKERSLLLLDNNCCCFSRAVYSIRPNCVNFLKNEIIPLVLDAIGDLTITDENSRSFITCIDKEKLFLYIITVFERSIITSIMNYWNSFCNFNKEHLSSCRNVDYSNPFVRAASTEMDSAVDMPTVSHPVAFTYRHGVYVSFIAINNIDTMINDCASDCIFKLKNIINNKVMDICRLCGDATCIEDLSEHVNAKMIDIILEEFRGVITNHWMSKIVVLFNELIVWSESELDKSSLLSLVKGFFNSVFTLVKVDVNKSSSVILNTIKYYVDGLQDIDHSKFTAEKIVTRSGHSMFGKCKFKLSEEFFYQVTKIRAEKLVLFRPIVLKELYRVMREGILDSYEWSVVSEKIFSISVEAAKEIIDSQHEALKKIISEARVICDDGVERKVKRREKIEITKSVMQSSNKRLREVVRLLWKNITAGSKISGAVNFGKLYAVANKNPDTKGKYSMFGKCKFRLSEDFFCQVTKIRSEKLVLFKPIVLKEFDKVMREGILDSYEWSVVSEKLFSIAVEATKEIIDSQRKALKKVISEACVICDDGVARKIKRKEKIEITKSVMQSSNKRLREVARLLWKNITAGNRSKSPSAVNFGKPSILDNSSEAPVVDGTDRNFVTDDSNLRFSLVDLRKEDRLEFECITGEFIRYFKPILCEIINPLLSDAYTPSSELKSILAKIKPAIYKRKVDCFIQNGFAARVESLLSRALIVMPSGNRVMTYNEKDKFLMSSMVGVNESIDVFTSEYVSSLISSAVPISKDEFAMESF
ncbi:hypothetical protein [Candidatus Ichthyocystis hellenicum]|uniref:hypothetical protein n=1 Tax=Candidatus Ichthyocystis hellenicum TaxID=1561003 RepID=UPI000AD888C6|nr:hypothetical protein [Candidatus Ichthyocystis hellenicum]